MRRSGLAGLAVVWLLALASPATAHPVPFSYLDVRVQPSGLDITLVVHVVDVGHELKIDPAARLLDPALLGERHAAIAALLESRVKIHADGRLLAADGWSVPEPLPERQSIRLRTRYQATSAPGLIAVDANFFPYDPPHQTFLNFYEGEAIATQAILDHSRTRFEHFTGSRQGTFAVVKRFIPSGVHHILIGPDHLLFLVGLLLLGGTLRQLALVVTAFTLAHSVTLSLAALNVLSPPARMIEPAIALSIVYVGADNLLVRNGRDVRAWIAFAFGFIHGFGFANVLADMDLPKRALGWTLFSFNLGVEVGQLIVVLAVATALAALRSRSEWAGRQLAFVGSVVVMAAGTFWFIERVFFPGGIS
jgi:hydrogenase/urease accessory protein HupE